ncbi:MAG: hemolysin family protein [Spirochaetota bacterium]
MTGSFILLGVLLVLSGFFSGTETAFTSLSPAQAHDLKRKHPRQGRIVDALVARPARLLTTVLIGNNLVNVAAAAVATVLTISLFGSGYEWATTAVVTVVLLIFGEVTPKQLAIVHNEGWVLRTCRLVNFLAVIFAPVIWFVTRMSNGIARLAGGKKRAEMTPRAILSVVDHAETIGVIKADQGKMVRGVLRFREVTVSAVMTHRTRVYSLDKNLRLAEAITPMIESGFSRIPVYEDDPERIVGIVIVRDAMREFATGDESQTLRQVMMEPIYVPENRRIDEMLSHFRRSKLNMAIVLDEYGGLAGIVTVEDIVEEILGEIYDENEQKEREKITREGHNTFLIIADVPLYVLNDSLDIELPQSRNVQSLGGYLADLAGHIPAPGETFETPPGRFEVVTTSRRHVVSVRFHRRPRENQSDEIADHS